MTSRVKGAADPILLARGEAARRHDQRLPQVGAARTQAGGAVPMADMSIGP